MIIFDSYEPQSNKYYCLVKVVTQSPLQLLLEYLYEQISLLTTVAIYALLNHHRRKETHGYNTKIDVL